MLHRILQQVHVHHAHEATVHHCSDAIDGFVDDELYARMQLRTDLRDILVELSHDIGDLHIEEFLLALDVREVQQFVDEVQQLQTVGIDQAQQVATLVKLYLVLLVAEHQVGETDDGVKRRAQRMTDIVQEDAFQFF